MEVQQVTREFIIMMEDKESKTLEDPNPNLTAEEVMDLYANQFSELLNAQIDYKGLVNDKLRYEFSTIAGTKG